MPTIVITGLILFIVLGVVTVRLYKPKPKYFAAVIGASLIGFFGLGMGATYNLGLNAAQTGAIGGYVQFLNGTVTDATVTPYTCTRDGDCTHTEDCDSYQVETSAGYTDSNGNYHPPQYTTYYHQCPLATMEYTYAITYTTHPDGTHPKTMVIADHIFAANPVRWSEWGGIDWAYSTPSLDGVSRGIPATWEHYKQDLAAGNADPITVQGTYDNYILGSEDEILQAYSGDINQLQKAHLLPTPTADMANPIYDNVDAAKMQFVCMSNPANAAAWQSALMHFNADLGTHLEGDMHVVAVKASCLNQTGVNAEAYLNAIKAYWLNDFGKNAIAKNTIILVLGVDDTGSTIQWAGAATGMPIGNGEMLQSLQSSLTGTAFSPSSVFGNTTAAVTEVNGTYVPRYTLGTGIVPQTVMVQYPFKRACMACTSTADKAAGDGGQGFTYLSTEIPLAGSTLVWSDIGYVLSMLLLWGIVFGVAIPSLVTEDPFRSSSRQSGREDSRSSNYPY